MLLLVFVTVTKPTELGWICDPDLQPPAPEAGWQRGEQPSLSVDSPQSLLAPGIPRVKQPPSPASFIQGHPSTFDITIISMFSELYIFLNAL